ncbi:hypothetical protein Pcaca05_05650 [Pectobacterium carotovorum subsp. carotovorum]|nr:hypothetical protein Pcaca05_05650 [Pectobacterium carotovorum subsp. carotovorum]
MNTLTNERLNELSTMHGADSGILEEAIKETAEMAHEILSLRAQLAELRGQSPAGEIVQKLEGYANPLLVVQFSEGPEVGDDVYLFPAPPAASQPSEMRETLYRIANHIAGAKGGMPDEWQDWADEVETDIRALHLGSSVPPATSQKITVTDDMAMAFHRATTDGDVGSDDVSDIKIGLNAALCNISMAQPYAARPSYCDGIEAAAKWLDKQREAFDNEHGRHDPDTGTFEFGNDAQLEHSSTLAELAEGIRALQPAASQPFVDKMRSRIDELETQLRGLNNQIPVSVPDYMTYLKEPIISNILSDDDNSPMAHAARILAVEVGFWRKHPLYSRPLSSQPYTVPDEMPTDIVIGDHPLLWNYAAGWNACRAAMLQSAPVQPAVITAEHRRVIGLLLGVCGVAFELADDTCQQEVDGEPCHVVPDNSFSRLSDWLDEIANTLPDQYDDLPNTVLQWGAVPRHALRSLLQPVTSPLWTGVGWAKGHEPINSPVIPEGWALVPIEPTEAMLILLGMTGSFDSMIAQYQKALAAAPLHKGE